MRKSIRRRHEAVMDSVLLGEILAVLLFLGVIVTVGLGFPVAFTLAGVGLIFALIGDALGVFDLALLSGLPNRYLGTMVNEVLVAVPLFIFMGVMLERSKLAEALLETMGQIFGSLRGGLALSVIFVGALLAASTGIVGATVVTMGLLSLPAMMRAGYDPKLAAGVICASGTLGQIIPPSTVLIFVGDILQGANQRAQMELGNLTPEPVSVGQLFLGALLPGLMLVTLYALYVVFLAIFRPSSAPALVMSAEEKRTLPARALKALLPPLVLILAVLGSILTGIATPTESASVGAVGATILAVLNRQFSLAILLAVMRSTTSITCMVFIILLGASVFSLVFRGLGGEHIVEDALNALPGGVGTAVLAVMLLMFILGFFLDTFEIIFIVVPITAPILLKMGVDPVWLGVMIGVNLQTSFLTPPFGFSLFYLRGVAKQLLTSGMIFRGAVPFVALQLIALVLLWEFPALTGYLPDRVFGGAALPAEASGGPAAIDDMLKPADPFMVDEYGGY
jgi:tripartite ATP-independent transporter DctM subunit